MLTAIIILLALGLVGNGFILQRRAIIQHAWPGAEAALPCAVTNSFDTLGIGSFAPTTA